MIFKFRKEATAAKAVVAPATLLVSDNSPQTLPVTSFTKSSPLFNLLPGVGIQYVGTETRCFSVHWALSLNKPLAAGNVEGAGGALVCDNTLVDLDDTDAKFLTPDTIAVLKGSTTCSLTQNSVLSLAYQIVVSGGAPEVRTQPAMVAGFPSTELTYMTLYEVK